MAVQVSSRINSMFKKARLDENDGTVSEYSYLAVGIHWYVFGGDIYHIYEIEPFHHPRG